MNLMTEHKVNKNGLNIHFIPTKKFKTIAIVVKLRTELTKETITKRALLTSVLREATINYPTRRQLQLKLDDLYGATLSVGGGKKGEDHVISFRLEIANERYLPSAEKITEEAMTLLEELIFQPYVTNNAFSEAIFNREKATLKQKMAALRDDKMSYANKRLIEEMCADEPYGLHVYGDEAALDALTPETLYDYYKEMITTDLFDLYVVGDFDSEAMDAKIATIFTGKINDEQVEKQPTTNQNQVIAKELIETDQLQQAKLHIGYRTNIVFSDDDYPALQVFNGLFGGFPNSKLFINVREKHSLAYYAASRIESLKGLLFVISGIAPDDFEQARDIIREQLEAMRTGDFTEADVTETKEMIFHQLRETLDSNYGIAELFYQQQLAGTNYSLADYFTKIEAVTSEDIVRVAKKIEEDTLYLLTAEGGK